MTPAKEMRDAARLVTGSDLLKSVVLDEPAATELVARWLRESAEVYVDAFQEWFNDGLPALAFARLIRQHAAGGERS